MPLDTSRQSFEECDTAPFVLHSHGQKVPPILHASREARTIGLEYYELSFGTEFDQLSQGARFLITTEPKIYVNWKHDIICPNLQCDLAVDQWTGVLMNRKRSMAKLSPNLFPSLTCAITVLSRVCVDKTFV